VPSDEERATGRTDTRNTGFDVDPAQALVNLVAAELVRADDAVDLASTPDVYSGVSPMRRGARVK